MKGIEAEGFLTDPDPLEADVKRAMIGRARTVILVAVAKKFDERGLSVIAGADRIHAAYLADPRPRAWTRSRRPGSRSTRSEFVARRGVSIRSDFGYRMPGLDRSRSRVCAETTGVSALCAFGFHETKRETKLLTLG